MLNHYISNIFQSLKLNLISFILLSKLTSNFLKLSKQSRLIWHVPCRKQISSKSPDTPALLQKVTPPYRSLQSHQKCGADAIEFINLRSTRKAVTSIYYTTSQTSTANTSGLTCCRRMPQFQQEIDDHRLKETSKTVATSCSLSRHKEIRSKSVHIKELSSDSSRNKLKVFFKAPKHMVISCLMPFERQGRQRA